MSHELSKESEMSSYFAKKFAPCTPMCVVGRSYRSSPVCKPEHTLFDNWMDPSPSPEPRRQSSVHGSDPRRRPPSVVRPGPWAAIMISWPSECIAASVWPQMIPMFDRMTGLTGGPAAFPGGRPRQRHLILEYRSGRRVSVFGGADEGRRQEAARRLCGRR